MLRFVGISKEVFCPAIPGHCLLGVALLRRSGSELRLVLAIAQIGCSKSGEAHVPRFSGLLVEGDVCKRSSDVFHVVALRHAQAYAQLWKGLMVLLPLHSSYPGQGISLPLLHSHLQHGNVRSAGHGSH